MAVGVMVIKVRASVRVSGSSNSVYKGNDCEHDGCAIHSSSSEADRGSWLRGVDCRVVALTLMAVKINARVIVVGVMAVGDDGCSGKRIVGVMAVMSIRVTAVRMIIVRLREAMMMTGGMMVVGVM